MLFWFTSKFKKLPFKQSKTPLLIRSSHERKQKIPVELLKPDPKLGNPGDVVYVWPGYMRHALFPKRMANYYILEGKVKKTLQSPEEMYKLFSGGHITLALLGKSYDRKEKNKEKLEFLLKYFHDLLTKLSILNHIPTITFECQLANAARSTTELKRPLKLEEVLGKIQEYGDIVIDKSNAKWQNIDSNEIIRIGKYVCLVSVNEVNKTVPIKVEVNPLIEEEIKLID
ncbi:2134_t:CDS:2 [Entrophospora sp. SA101]|nr:4193_t:CDS:2 [Entrophospora sp. SA101]CAJ0761933.1 11597_t:CDS:2 [Entrophospora sp. SA101]CAJ0767518.1 2134_t:CDS:2 [Entrophospora sp. SA101]CAJ0904541.1 12601_t:CDS:2 [Entrophospora sp. SA101]